MITRVSRLSLLVAVSMLTACVAFNPPKPQLPSRSTLTAGETITVQGTQTVYAVARAHNVSMRDLIVLNNLQPPFSLRPGQSLVLPAGASSSDFLGTPTSDGMRSAPVAPVLSNPAIESVELAPLPKAESKPAPRPTQVDVLNKPKPLLKAVSTTMNGEPSTEKKVPQAPQAVVAPVVDYPPDEPANKVAAAKDNAATHDNQPDNNAEAPAFVWPVQGPILSSYGPKGQGLSNDGINIGAPKGAPVVAAAGGIVVYAGNEMKGFGNLILIRHAGGWVTAYAHLDRVLVAKDAVVASGDMIATVGKTGTVNVPQLHFETRHNSKAVDPAGLIK